MKTNYLYKNASDLVRSYQILLILLFSWATVSGQTGHSVKVTNDQQLKAAVENPAVNSLVIEAGYYASLDRYLGPGITAKKAENGNGGRATNCIYAIQESTACFDPVEE